MAKKDMFGDDEKSQGNDFGSLFEQSLNQGKIRQGDNLKGEILSIGKETVFVSTGTPIDGFLPTLEILDENKKVQFKVGDIIDVVVVRVGESQILLRYKKAKGGATDIENLEDAFDMELPVEGKVLEQVKGGFRVDIGGTRSFCPMGQIDLRHPTDPESYVGKKFEFVITAFENKGRNVVVSRKKLLAQGQAEEEGKFLESAQVGDLFEGTISRIEKFGAFIRLDNNIEGLIPMSELSWTRVQKAEDVVQPGMTVRVKLLKIDDTEAKLKLSFSIKQGGGELDPWTQIAEKFPLGSIHKGIVEKKEAYGLFVNIEGGITGLLPRSKWKDSTEASQYENKKRGDSISVQIDMINTEERKISLGLPGEKTDESWRDHMKGSSKQGFGTMGDLLKSLNKK